jgi:hypothetical protein
MFGIRDSEDDLTIPFPGLRLRLGLNSRGSPNAIIACERVKAQHDCSS